MSDKMTRQQAIEAVGQAVIDLLDREDCDFTNRVTGDEWVEFSASARTKQDDIDVTVYAYYYQKQSDIDAVETLDMLDWEVDHYRIM